MKTKEFMKASNFGLIGFFSGIALPLMIFLFFPNKSLIWQESEFLQDIQFIANNLFAIFFLFLTGFSSVVICSLYYLLKKKGQHFANLSITFGTNLILIVCLWIYFAENASKDNYITFFLGFFCGSIIALLINTPVSLRANLKNNKVS